MPIKAWLTAAALAVVFAACSGDDAAEETPETSSSPAAVSSSAISSAASSTGSATDCSTLTLDESHCFLNYVTLTPPHQRCCDTWIAALQ